MEWSIGIFGITGQSYAWDGIGISIAMDALFLSGVSGRVILWRLYDELLARGVLRDDVRRLIV